jgi:murein L,D-transpeptidase YafK
MKRLLIAAGFALALAACNDQFASSQRAQTPIPPRTMALMAEKGMGRSDPILVRLYKKESELEVWKKASDGRYAMLKSFPICRWSGQLGPKTKEGDRQAPEGFYSITPGLMNPNSAYYLSFNTGYPNAFDREHGRTGSELMVHGTCSSRGCYAMTDDGIAEVYALAREAFSGGQRSFQFQAYPFRMTAENLAKFRKDPNMPFWANLKEGADHFEVTKQEPKVGVCNGRYAFDTVGGSCAPDPAIAPAIAEKESTDRQAVAELIAKGTPAVKLVYADGGGHESFREASLGSESNYSPFVQRPQVNLGDVSRPDALAQGPREVAIEESTAPVVAAVSRRSTPIKVAAHSPTPLTATAQAPRTMLASADPEQPISAPAPTEKPFYDRLGGIFTNGGPAAPVVASTAPVAEAPLQQPVAAATKAAAARPKPTPPAKKAEAKVPAPHPVTGQKTPGLEKHAQNGGLIPGSTPTGPVATAFKAN